MKTKNKKTAGTGLPFPGYRFVIMTGICLLASVIIIFSVFFYLKYSEILFLILATLITIIFLSHVTGRIAVKVVNHGHKKKNNY
jgi:hypothetical protein